MDEKSSIDDIKLDNPYALLNITQNSDGSLTRFLPFPDVPPTAQPPPPQQEPTPYVLSKDLPLNPSNHTWIRIYRPYLISTPTFPLPIIIYFHGSGFIVASAATSFFHECCERLALQVPAVVLNVEYRLAPEHRLPAAYDDGMDAVRWVKEQAGSEPWMAPEVADSSRCFLMGSSAGGTIAYYLWRQLAAAAEPEVDRPTFKIAGVILDQPFFGGVERTESELRMAKDPALPLLASDLMWELALPVGADRDHEYSNPESLEKKLGGADGGGSSLSPCLLRASGKDPLVDRQLAVMKMVEEKGVKVVGKLDEEGFHGIQFFEKEKNDVLIMEVKDFVSSVIIHQSTHEHA
ncbi:hypothetical protein ACLOJK_033620 [Asimina triloba]